MTTILFAPSVHTGGGLVLLAELCRSWTSNQPCTAFLDARALDKIEVPASWEVVAVPRAFIGRLRAERELARRSKNAELVFCFHNLPPVFACRAPVICYVQNPVLIGLADLTTYPSWVRLRLQIERFISRRFKANANEYWVQTPTMARALHRWLSADGSAPAPILQKPFTDRGALSVPAATVRSDEPVWDFLYVSDGQAHKNHLRLFEAWVLLAQVGLKPSLAITLHPERDRALAEVLRHKIADHDLQVTDLGQMRRDAVLTYYRRAKAMLFASTAESYGIPFLEARAAGIPIIAAERDFVRDMCDPVETFDPLSAVSIARAVRRFLNNPEPPLNPLTPAAFVGALLSSRDRQPRVTHPAVPTHRRAVEHEKATQ